MTAKPHLSLLVACVASCVAASTVRAQYDAVVQGDNPLYYYRFEEASTASPAVNEGLFAGLNDGTYTGGITLGLPSSNPALGNAMRLDGAAGTFVDLGLFHPGDSVTVEAWVNLSSAAPAGTFHAAVARWDGSYELDVANSELANFVVRNDANTFGVAASGAGVTRDAWHHLVGVFDSGNVTVFLDGVQGTTQAVGGVLQDAGPVPDRILIGGTRSGTVSSFNFNGSIDEVAIYNYALSPAQVSAHYNAGSPPPPPPVPGDIVVFETNNEPNFALPAAFGSFPTIPSPSNSDYADQNSGNGVTIAVAQGSPNPMAPNSGDVVRLNDGVIMDQDIDCCDVGGNGPNGVVDAAWFVDGSQRGRWLMTMPTLVDVESIATYAGIAACCQNRGAQNYTVWGSAAENPDSAGNLANNADWVKIADVSGGPALQTAAQISSSTGSLGVYRHLLFDISSGGDGVHDFYGEIDVVGAPIPEPSTVALALIGCTAMFVARRMRSIHRSGQAASDTQLVV
ncbi:MAG: hypothetical protein DCC68_15600 [Planctomycetota bacterium]|nr:MAG: hypothetical protein DCC68_15600 [Planctomycetota bacterium]